MPWTCMLNVNKKQMSLDANSQDIESRKQIYEHINKILRLTFKETITLIYSKKLLPNYAFLPKSVYQ